VPFPLARFPSQIAFELRIGIVSPFLTLTNFKMKENKLKEKCMLKVI
jgi:hypothetical protein